MAARRRGGMTPRTAPVALRVLGLWQSRLPKSMLYWKVLRAAVPSTFREVGAMSGDAGGWWPRLVARAGRGIEHLYRWHLGWLFGHRIAVVTHVGRRSGKTYRTVLYVQHYDPQRRDVTVISVWGESDWLRNIRAAPALRVEIGRASYLPKHRFLTSAEIVDIERDFRRAHRLLARGQALLMRWPWPASDEQLIAMAEPLRGVTFSPHSGPALRPRTAPTQAA